ncbi:unnamed protein product [Sphagnum tenellum]
MEDDPIERKTTEAPRSLWNMVREYQRQEKISRLAEAWRRLVLKGYYAWQKERKNVSDQYETPIAPR